MTQIVPTLVDTYIYTELSGVALYTFDVPNVQSSGGIYYIDLSSVDSSGNPINCNGILTVNVGHLNIVSFVLNPSFNPAYAPGLEFTVFFKNPPLASLRYEFLTIGLQKPYTDGPYIPYIYSPPLPSAFSPTDIFQSLTFKSDGTNFNVTSSGPAGWMGVGLINVLLGFYS